MSLLAEYSKERLNREAYENERGFVIYEITEDVCYIVDIFVRKECRRHRVASHLADHVERIAKEKGCKTLLGSVVPTANGATDSLKAMLSYGFKLQSSQANFIWLEKDL